MISPRAFKEIAPVLAALHLGCAAQHRDISHPRTSLNSQIQQVLDRTPDSANSGSITTASNPQIQLEDNDNLGAWLPAEPFSPQPDPSHMQACEDQCPDGFHPEKYLILLYQVCVPNKQNAQSFKDTCKGEATVKIEPNDKFGCIVNKLTCVPQHIVDQCGTDGIPVSGPHPNGNGTIIACSNRGPTYSDIESDCKKKGTTVTIRMYNGDDPRKVKIDWVCNNLERFFPNSF